MQYLKEEMRNKIVDEALKEFLKSGYKDTSIRTIVKNAETSIGNFYKYFKSKEDLYETIVEPVYSRLIQYVNRFFEVEVNEKMQEIFYSLSEEVIKIFEENRNELAVLLNSSKGSKYENCKKIFIEFITRTVTISFEYQLSMYKKAIEDNFIIKILSYNFVEDIAIVLKEKRNKREVRKLISDLLEIFYGNIIGKLEVREI
ncbi:TetR/AcrR family transcriptional regulator [Clostridium felsineum]|uniref:TetR/AcrR family transcriptional regulator n=1 Tax=Clostridium felsineum TaxID=36839 RepID=UPI00098CC7FC|nr:TetR/AcrR family transcriptional regulator [Clostridium felsineum]URZ17428.1 hypothetical protein CLFE_034810 [Clostridium felsineum DSM 794]